MPTLPSREVRHGPPALVDLHGTVRSQDTHRRRSCRSAVAAWSSSSSVAGELVEPQEHQRRPGPPRNSPRTGYVRRDVRAPGPRPSGPITRLGRPPRGVAPATPPRSARPVGQVERDAGQAAGQVGGEPVQRSRRQMSSTSGASCRCPSMVERVRDAVQPVVEAERRAGRRRRRRSDQPVLVLGTDRHRSRRARTAPPPRRRRGRGRRCGTARCRRGRAGRRAGAWRWRGSPSSAARAGRGQSPGPARRPWRAGVAAG